MTQYSSGIAATAISLFCSASVCWSTPQTIIVAMDGSGKFKTIQEAVAAVPDNSTDRTTIRIKAGTYQGPVVIPKVKVNVTFAGESPEKTILTYAKNVRDPRPEGAHIFNPGLDVLGNDFCAENMTIQNTSGDHGQALATHLAADRLVFRNCRLLGWQDTLLLDKGRYFFKDCYIEGRVDFIYGEGTAVFNGCEIHSKNGGFITAASTKPEVPFGFVFVDCRLTGDPAPWVDPTGKIAPPASNHPVAYLGRPWRPYGNVAFIDCTVGNHISSAGWDNWGNVENEKTARYAEYGSKTPDGKPIDLAIRAPWAKALTPTEAGRYRDVPTVLDGWNPQGTDTVAPHKEAFTAPPVLPSVPRRTFSLSDFGAVGDGKTDATGALKAAFAACDKAGGGQVVIPAGRYLTHPLMLVSNLDLHLEKGAVLLFATDPADYELPNKKNRQCLEAADCHDVSITGEGTIDGQGSDWWPRYVKTYVAPAGSPPPLHRPYMVVFSRCQRVLVEGVTLTNSPSFHLVPAQSQDVTIRNVRITAPANAPNTDGIDPSGWNFAITGCTIDVGDDNIALKPVGLIAPDKPSCRNFLIENCTFRHGHGMSIGGQTPGGLDNLIVRNCVFEDTLAGIRMKAPRGNGGLVENLLYEHLTMTRVKVPIYITSYYPRTPDDPATDPAQSVPKTPIWRHIRISDVKITDSPEAGRIIGVAEMLVEDITFTNVHIAAEKGLQVIHARGIRFVSSDITTRGKPVLTVANADVTGLDLAK